LTAVTETAAPAGYALSLMDISFGALNGGVLWSPRFTHTALITRYRNIYYMEGLVHISLKWSVLIICYAATHAWWHRNIYSPYDSILIENWNYTGECSLLQGLK
jgi:hypothetical protein